MFKRIFSVLLAVCMLMGTISVAVAEPALTADDIETVKAYTGETFYGDCLKEVVITYKEGTDLSGVSPELYHLTDRGYKNPTEFLEIPLSDVQAEGNTVTLIVDPGTRASEGNTWIYADDPERCRDLGGSMYTSANWHRTPTREIVYEVAAPGATAYGYQMRESLELKLWHEGESEETALCLANEDGTYNPDGKWLPTEDAIFGEMDAEGKVVRNGFFSFDQLGIQVPTNLADEDYVVGYMYVPDDYDPQKADGYAMVIYLAGSLTCRWILDDGSTNLGCNVVFDSAAADWMDSNAIIVEMHDFRYNGKTLDEDGNRVTADYIPDILNMMKYVYENYNINEDLIYMTGSSGGTRACCTVIDALLTGDYDNPLIGEAGTEETINKEDYPFDVDVFVSCAGVFGSGWGEDDWEAVAKDGLKVWIIQGEQDYASIDTYPVYQKSIEYYKAAGWGDAWIADNVRFTYLPTEIFYYWGEIDHSSCRAWYWYFYDQVYRGPLCNVDENGELYYTKELDPWDTYHVEGRGQGDFRAEYECVVYPDSQRDWALSRDTWNENR